MSRQNGVLRKELKAQALAARVQKLNGVVNSMQVAAYGQQGDLLSKNNLLLAGNQLLWNFISQLLPAGGALSTILPPLGSLVTGAAVIGTRQNERFISGVETVAALPLSVSLRDRIAPGLWEEFRQRTDVPVTITILDPNVSVSIFAAVRDGSLVIIRDDSESFSSFAMISISRPVRNKFRIAWMVDTGNG
jgi:hypothetical protein